MRTMLGTHYAVAFAKHGASLPWIMRRMTGRLIGKSPTGTRFTAAEGRSLRDIGAETGRILDPVVSRPEIREMISVTKALAPKIRPKQSVETMLKGVGSAVERDMALQGKILPRLTPAQAARVQALAQKSVSIGQRAGQRTVGSRLQRMPEARREEVSRKALEQLGMA